MEDEKIILKTTVNLDGIYTCDEMDITVEEWKSVLQDSFIYENYKLWLARFYQEPEHKASCKFMGDKYKCSAQTPNSVITKFCIATRRILNRFDVKGTDGNKTYWVIAMKQGKYVDGHFEWTMRDELVQAIEELDMTDPEKFEGNKHIKLKTWQEIYNESNWIKTDWNNKYVETINIVRENISNIHWSDDCIYRLLKSSSNGISSVNRGQLTNEHYEIIKQNWNFYEATFNKISNEKKITQELFDEIKNKTHGLTGINYTLVINRAICGLLPGILSTAPGVDFFYERVKLIKEFYPETPELKGNWLIDNLNFVAYCKEQVNFLQEYHASGFIFDLFDYCKNIQGETQMENPQDKLISETKNLLENTKNLILTGAPGTGKTYLAKQIAKAMGCTDNEIGFVQFHQSYDYTDFVEGLRPVQNDGNNQIGFERKDGVFKEFCGKALKSIFYDSNENVDNFEECWKKLVDELDENNFVIIPLISGKGDFRVELNEYGTGLANRTYENDDFQKGNWIQGKSKFFSKDQLYNIYQGLPGTPAGGHDNYRKAVIEYMKKNLGLMDYKKSETTHETKKNFVFIIDEINRGEVSKIFGELFYCVDPGYRGERGRINTQYQNLIFGGEFQKGFFIPENVYIIGTMNDIDRSVESMDFAFRRRFAWKEVKASDTIEMLYPKTDENGNSTGLDSVELAKKAIERMNRLNNAIWKENSENEEENKEKIEGLSSAYHIGASYFLKLNQYEGSDEERFEKLWEFHLEGLLKEYLRGSGSERMGMDILRKAYFEE